ncbi:MAG: hypothetical protein J6568_00400 [Snodgrassella sp.]|nr:hypothetical protein [Snodgrassella sp.]
MKKIILAVLLAVSIPCFAKDIIFSCNIANGKKLSVTREHQGYRYQFGRDDKPELIFFNKVEDVDMGVTTNGYTGERMRSIEMTNKGYEYSINSTNKKAGVTVFDGKNYTAYSCKSGTIINNIPNQIM